jgi:hypothetical protein
MKFLDSLSPKPNLMIEINDGPGCNPGMVIIEPDKTMSAMIKRYSYTIMEFKNGCWRNRPEIRNSWKEIYDIVNQLSLSTLVSVSKHGPTRGTKLWGGEVRSFPSEEPESEDLD